MAEFDFSQAIGEARAKYESISKALDVDRLKADIKDLETQAAAPGLWDDPENAQKITSRLSAAESQLKRLNSASQRIDDVETLVELGHEEGDQDSLDEAQSEIGEIQKDLDQMEIQTLLDGEYDERSAVVTIRSGAGGVDAADFAQMLLRMYLRYAERQGWQVEIVSKNESDLGGYKEVICRVIGEGAYSRLKFESGGHRVQRVPATEAQGRIHTSACTVAVLPELDEVQQVEINPADLRIDVYRASGAGGQHVQKTDSAVRITHLPTGMVVECQDERSQRQNKNRAMAVLASRLYAAEVAKQQAEQASTRKSLVGSGDRSERIRTYNYPQGRVTDHRINLTLYKLDAIMDGDLEEIITALTAEHQAEQLAQLGEH